MRTPAPVLAFPYPAAKADAGNVGPRLNLEAKPQDVNGRGTKVMKLGRRVRRPMAHPISRAHK